MGECHVDDSTEGQYDIIITRYILEILGINLR